MRLLSYVFTVLFVISRAQEQDVQLSFFPPGSVHKSGSYIKIICKARMFESDVLKVMKNVDGTSVEISANRILTDTFKNTNRYALMSSIKDGYTETFISIKRLQGKDAGEIECWHTGRNQVRTTTAEILRVLVPPHSVQIMHYNGGSESTVPDGGTVVFREGEDHGILCKTMVAGSSDTPTVNITLDGQNVMDRFAKEQDIQISGVRGLQQKNLTLTYDFITKTPNLGDNGKTLVCSLATEGYDAISQQVKVEVHYAPKIECDEAKGSLGQKIQMFCRGRMFPSLQSGSLHWTRGQDTFRRDFNYPDFEQNRIRMTYSNEPPSESYEFTIHFDDLQSDDFGMFVFEVENSHSVFSREFELEEIVTTTVSLTTQAATDKTTINGYGTKDYVIPTDNPSAEEIGDPETGESTGAASELCTHLINLILPMLFSIAFL